MLERWLNYLFTRNVGSIKNSARQGQYGSELLHFVFSSKQMLPPAPEHICEQAFVA